MKYNYHDAVIERCQIGPRREVTLDLRLATFNSTSVRLRFSAVDNFMEVNSFFARPSPFDDPDALERVEQVTPIEKWKWLVEVEYRGAVTIVTRKAPEETLA
jgi:hypothetical protein